MVSIIKAASNAGAAPASGESALRESNRWRLDTTMGRLGAYAHMLLADHGFLRLAYLNLHQVADGAYRSAQPAPHQFRRIAALGVKTVINLRGGREIGSYALERDACAKLGLDYLELRLNSRNAPLVPTIEAAADAFHSVRYPVLWHCKAGADRAGLMTAFYYLIKENRTGREAARALSLRYGHVRQGPTGVLDAVIAAYVAAEDRAAAEGRTPPDFMTWVRTEYDRRGLNRAFKSSRWGSILVDRILGRE